MVADLRDMVLYLLRRRCFLKRPLADYRGDPVSLPGRMADYHHASIVAYGSYGGQGKSVQIVSNHLHLYCLCNIDYSVLCFSGALSVLWHAARDKR